MKDKLDRYIDGIRQLPPTPTLMVKLITTFQRPDYDVDEVVRLMSLDPSLTTEVLKRCNSAFFAAEDPVSDMFDAVLRLGFYEVYRLVVSMSSASVMSWSEIGGGLEAEELWQHSVAAAVAAGEVAGALHQPEGTVFTAGLLHDVGKIVFASAEKTEYARLLARAGSSGQPLAEAEKEAFGFDHGEIGARLLTRWGLPPEIAMPVCFHHCPATAGPFEQSSAIVNLGNIVAHCLAQGPPAAAGQPPCGAAAAKVLHLPLEQLPALLGRIRESVSHAKGLVPA